MLSLRTLAMAAATAPFVLVGCAQMPGDHDAHHSDAAPVGGMTMPMGGTGASISRMDEQMKTMQSMHDKMAKATPEQRSALMAEHMKVMQDSMAMMGDMAASDMMGKDGMGGMGMAMGGTKDKPAMPADKSGLSGMQGMHGKGSMDGAMGMNHQMMEKRMQMMQSMMQMMMDSMPAVAAKT